MKAEAVEVRRVHAVMLAVHLLQEFPSCLNDVYVLDCICRFYLIKKITLFFESVFLLGTLWGR